MHIVTAIQGDAVSQEDLGAVLADYVSLDQTRIIRRLLVVRCGGLACVAAIIGTLVPGFSLMSRLGSIALFLIPPIWVWVTELRMERRLSTRLEHVDGAQTRVYASGSFQVDEI